MFSVMVNLLFKLHRLVRCSPIPHCSLNRGSLQEVTLRVFWAVICGRCSHVQAHACVLIYTYWDTSSRSTPHLGRCSITLVE